MKTATVVFVVMILFSVRANAQQPERKILLEEFSTAPCGFCPDGDIVAEQLVKDHPSVIWITHHAGFGTDSLTVTESATIANAFTTFAPGACVDRGNYPIPVYTMPPYIAVSRQKWDSVCTAHLSDPRTAAISIDNRFDAATRTLTCTVGVTFLTAPSEGDMRINLYVVEDSAKGSGKGWDQTNYYNTTPGHPCYQKGDPIVGYNHRRVVRAVPGGAWGVASVIPAIPEIGKTYSRVFTVPIPARWDVNGLETVAFASYYNSDAAKRPVIDSESKRVSGSVSFAENIPIALPRNILALSPNPARDALLVSRGIGSGDSALLQLFDRMGRLVATAPFVAGQRDLTLPVGHLPAGTYFTRLLGDLNGSPAARLIILH